MISGDLNTIRPILLTKLLISTGPMGAESVQLNIMRTDFSCEAQKQGEYRISGVGASSLLLECLWVVVIASDIP